MTTSPRIPIRRRSGTRAARVLVAVLGVGGALAFTSAHGQYSEGHAVVGERAKPGTIRKPLYRGQKQTPRSFFQHSYANRDHYPSNQRYPITTQPYHGPVSDPDAGIFPGAPMKPKIPASLRPGVRPRLPSPVASPFRYKNSSGELSDRPWGPEQRNVYLPATPAPGRSGGAPGFRRPASTTSPPSSHASLIRDKLTDGKRQRGEGPPPGSLLREVERKQRLEQRKRYRYKGELHDPDMIRRILEQRRAENQRKFASSKTPRWDPDTPLPDAAEMARGTTGYVEESCGSSC